MNSSQLPSNACLSTDLEKGLSALEGRWKILILYHLFSASVLRFSQLERLLAGVSQKMLSQRLRELESDGIIVRTVHPEVPPRVDYHLSARGKALLPALTALHTWATNVAKAD